MKNAKLKFSLLLVLSSFNKPKDGIRLIFEEQKSMRSSFCMYSDGRFYEARPSGCVGQEFASGYWENRKDTVRLIYKTENVYRFEILKTVDTASKFQIVRIIDCYNQPVRFQNVCFDTACQNLYNPGLAKIGKGKSILYLAPIFEQNGGNVESINSNADTVTFRWLCNRESIESISGGTLYINQEPGQKKVILKSKSVVPLSQ
jgi:hypothetical protein